MVNTRVLMPGLFVIHGEKIMVAKVLFMYNVAIMIFVSSNMHMQFFQKDMMQVKFMIKITPRKFTAKFKRAVTDLILIMENL